MKKFILQNLTSQGSFVKDRNKFTHCKHDLQFHNAILYFILVTLSLNEKHFILACDTDPLSGGHIEKWIYIKYNVTLGWSIYIYYIFFFYKNFVHLPLIRGQSSQLAKPHGETLIILSCISPRKATHFRAVERLEIWSGKNFTV